MSRRPQSWARAKLGEVLQFKYGKSLPARMRRVGKVNVYGSNGVVGEHDTGLTGAPAIVIGRKGSVGEVHFSERECWPIDTTYFIDEFSGQDPRFWYYTLRQLQLGTLDRATAIPGLNREDAYALEVYVPPLAEQKRIADKLKRLLAAVDACKARLDAIPAILKRFRQSVLAAATSGELTEGWRGSAGETVIRAKVNEPYLHFVEGPNGWHRTTFAEVCELIGGSQPPKATFMTTESADTVRLIQIRDYKSDKFKVFIPRKLARRFCTSTDVMIGRYGPPIFQILRGLEGAYNVALMKAHPRSGALTRDYLFYWLKQDALLRYVEAGSDRTAGQDGIRKELLHQYPFFLPSVAEQMEIVRRVESLFALADSVERRYQHVAADVESLSRSLLVTAFKGELNLSSGLMRTEVVPQLASSAHQGIVSA